MATFMPSSLSNADKDHFLGLAKHWAVDSMRKDIAGWHDAGRHFGQEPHIWHYNQYKLTRFLEAKTRAAGQAAWAWRDNGNLFFGYIYSDGSSQGQQSSPLSAVESGNRWWPVIFLVPHGMSVSDLFPMYCPVLAQNFSRPWFGHRSRLFTFDPQWIDELQAAAQAIAQPVIVPVLVPVIVQDPGQSHDPWHAQHSPAQSESSYDPWQADHSHHISTVTGSESWENVPDIANLDDVDSEGGNTPRRHLVIHPQASSSHQPAPTIITGLPSPSSCGSSQGSSLASYNVYASSSATTAATLQDTSRRNRWARHKKSDDEDAKK